MTQDVDKSRSANATIELEEHEEIDVTEEMINAGLSYMDESGISLLTSRVTYPDFVIEFYQAMTRARREGRNGGL